MTRQTLIQNLTARLWTDARTIGTRRDPLWPSRVKKQGQWAGLAIQAGSYRAFLDAVHNGHEQEVRDAVVERLERLIAAELGMPVVVHGKVHCRACGGTGEVAVVHHNHFAPDGLDMDGWVVCGECDGAGSLRCGICGESAAVLRVGDDECCEGCRREVCDFDPPMVATSPSSSPEVVDGRTRAPA